MQFVGNLLWFLIFGLALAIVYVVVGLVLCVTIVFAPFGKQMFKLARLVIWPFVSIVETEFGSHPIANSVCLIFGGFILAAAFFILGLVLHITIIGIPFAKQCFKLMKLSALPYGAEIT
jgi:uncharacterized membrane protein YccF (DUF307 family)